MKILYTALKYKILQYSIDVFLNKVNLNVFHRFPKFYVGKKFKQIIWYPYKASDVIKVEYDNVIIEKRYSNGTYTGSLESYTEYYVKGGSATFASCYITLYQHYNFKFIE